MTEAAYLPTGNEYLCAPTLRESDGAIETLNVALMRLDGLLELEGDADHPLLMCEGLARHRGELHWAFDEHWVPRMRFNGSGTAGCVLIPPDQRFVLYRRPIAETEAERCPFTFALSHIFQTVNTRCEIPNWTCRARLFNWSYIDGVVIEIFAGGGLLATVSLRGGEDAEYRFIDDAGVQRRIAPGAVFETDRPFRIQIDTATPTLALGFGLSPVAARSADLEAVRVKEAEWHRRTLEWLAQRRVECPDDPELTEVVNRNGHFARFFAMSRALDTSEWVAMTSRSHRYYVSSAYWDRDSLLWSFPFYLHNDPERGEALLRYAFGRQLTHAGIHSRSIAGQVLEFGFELDELVAPLIALGRWATAWPDAPLWAEEGFRHGILELLERLKCRRHPEAGLFATELMPTDDHLNGGRAYLTYNNVLVWHALRLIEPLVADFSTATAEYCRSEAAALAPAIRAHLVRDGIFQWATDLNGNHEFYDEAPGSLLLLTYYGFCPVDDPVYRATVARLYSDAYPFRLEGRFSELGNRHTGTPHPWILSACNSVLSGARVEQGLAILREAPMDNRIACESIDVATGRPRSGLHFATCAGFVAHAIQSILERHPELSGARS